MSIDQLAAKIAAVPLNGRGHRRYPKALKQDIMSALASSDLSRRDFASRIGLAAVNLEHWRGFAPKRKSGGPAASQFKNITVEADRSSARLSVRAPGGVIVDGLTVDAVADLIAALAARSSC